MLTSNDFFLSGGLTMKVRFCQNNKGKGTVLRRLLEEHPDLDVGVEKCLGICGPCAGQPVAVVGGTKVTGSDGDDLYRRIVAAAALPNVPWASEGDCLP